MGRSPRTSCNLYWLLSAPVNLPLKKKGEGGQFQSSHQLFELLISDESGSRDQLGLIQGEACPIPAVILALQGQSLLPFPTASPGELMHGSPRMVGAGRHLQRLAGPCPKPALVKAA